MKTKKPKDEKTALLTYVSILFAAAFLLVLFSYLLATRNSNDRLTELRENSTTYQTLIDTMQNEIDGLESKNAALSAQISELESELSDTEYQKDSMLEAMRELDAALTAKDEVIAGSIDERSALREEIAGLEQEVQAGKDELENLSFIYTLLWRASAYYDQQRYDECRSLLEQMKELGADDYLLSSSDGSVSSSAVYKKIADYFG